MKAGRITASLLALLSLALFTLAWSSATSGIYRSILSGIHQRWDAGLLSGTPPTAADIEKASGYAGKLLATAPHDSRSLTLVAKTAQWQAYVSPSPDWHYARSLHQRSLDYRPFWPYNQVNLVKIAASEGSNPEQIWSRIENLAQSAPASDAVTEVVIDQGFTGWSTLSEKRRLLVSKTFFSLTHRWQDKLFLSDILARSPGRQKGCQLARLSRIWLPACQLLQN